MTSLSGASEISGAEDKQKLHWTYRQQRKGVNNVANTKDFCPFYREDSAPECRVVQPATPHQRRPQSPPPRLEGSGAQPHLPCDVSRDPHAFVAAKASDIPRDWDFQQHKRYSQEGYTQGSVQLRSPQLSYRRAPTGSTTASQRGADAQQPRWR